jgi:hypothetical protein
MGDEKINGFYLMDWADISINNDLCDQVFAKGTSTVGSGAEAKSGQREVPVVIEGVAIAPVCSPCFRILFFTLFFLSFFQPFFPLVSFQNLYQPTILSGMLIGSFMAITMQGDIIFCDPLEGVVAIPRLLLTDVLELMPKLVAQDDKVKKDVEHGVSVFDAFKRHRIP